jgi:hypothetical protein
VSCIPSPESPAKSTVASGSVSTGLRAIYVVRLKVEEALSNRSLRM